jgi:hypothetical protein
LGKNLGEIWEGLNWEYWRREKGKRVSSFVTW